MPFTITISTPLDAVSIARDSAQQALDTMMQFRRAGIQQVEVRDGGGRKLTQQQLELLLGPKSED